MMRFPGIVFACFLLVACHADQQNVSYDDASPIEIISGYEFLTDASKELQDDAFSNPGFLWVDKGKELFGAGHQSCASCHTDNLVGVAARYPKTDANSGQLWNLEARINACLLEQQNLPALEYESDDLLALTAFVAHQSRGMPMRAGLTPENEAEFERGRAYFYTRRGQFNLSCSNCHNQNWGKQLRGDTISQGHGNGFPAYRFEWQNIGSLHRRFRDCDTGVRAEPLPYGSATYIALELYLAERSKGLPIETPAVRR